MSKKEKLPKNQVPASGYIYPPMPPQPMTDGVGREIRYKRRGGVWPFFMGFFACLFFLVFILGTALSILYYCVKLEDIGKTLGVNIDFLGVSGELTIQQAVQEGLKLKDDYVNLTLNDAKTKLNFDLRDFIQHNLNIDVGDIYNAEISLSGINGGALTKIGNFRLQDIANNMDEFLSKALPEVYKNVSVGDLLARAEVNLSSLGYPIFTEPLFNMGTPESLIMKTLEQLSVYQLLNVVMPEYLATDTLTLGFIQTAFGINLIPDTIGEDPEWESKYGALLATTISNLNVDTLTDTITVRSILELAGLDIIPLDDAEGRYDALLNSKLSEVNPDTLFNQITIGAILDLVPSLDVSGFPFLDTEAFRAQVVNDVPDYLLGLTLSEIIESIPNEIYPYDRFEIDEVAYFISGDQILIRQTIAIATAEDVQTFEIEGNIYTLDLEDGEVLDATNALVTEIVNMRFTLGGIEYRIDGETLVFFEEVATITRSGEPEEATFELDEIDYLLGETSISEVANPANEFEIIAKTDAVQSLLYSIRNMTIKDLLDGNSADILSALDGVAFGDLMGGDLGGILSYLKDITLGELLKDPAGLMSAFESVPLSEFGISNTDKLIGGLATLTIGDLMNNPDAMMDAIQDVTLGELFAETPTGLMGIISDLTIGDLMNDPDAVSDLLSSSEMTLADMLGITPSNSLMNAILWLKVGELFGGGAGLETALSSAIDSVSISDVLGSDNFLLDAIIGKADGDTLATIGNLPELIEKLTLGDLFETAPTGGFISLLSVTEGTETYTGTGIPLSMLGEALGSLDIMNCSIPVLIEAGLLGAPFLKTQLDPNENEEAKTQYADKTLTAFFTYLSTYSGIIDGFLD